MRAAFATAGCFALAAALSPASAEELTGTVRAGVPTTVVEFASYDRMTCTHGALPIMSVAQPPAHGTVTFQKSQHEAVDGRCAGKILRGMATIYRSNPGYRGPDSFSVDAQTEIYSNDVGMRTNRISVSVQVK